MTHVRLCGQYQWPVKDWRLYGKDEMYGVYMLFE